MARDCAYFRTAPSVIGPTTPSIGPGLKPAALSLPCSSRISSVVNGAALACAAAGTCGVDKGGGGSGVDLASSCATAEGATGGGKATRIGETGGEAFSSGLSTSAALAFACSRCGDADGLEGGDDRPQKARAMPANSISSREPAQTWLARPETARDVAKRLIDSKNCRRARGKRQPLGAGDVG